MAIWWLKTLSIHLLRNPRLMIHSSQWLPSATILVAQFREMFFQLRGVIDVVVPPQDQQLWSIGLQPWQLNKRQTNLLHEIGCFPFDSSIVIWYEMLWLLWVWVFVNSKLPVYNHMLQLSFATVAVQFVCAVTLQFLDDASSRKVAMKLGVEIPKKKNMGMFM